MVVRAIKQLYRGNGTALCFAQYSLAVLLAAFFIIDVFVIPYLEDAGKVVSTGWIGENRKVYTLF